MAKPNKGLGRGLDALLSGGKEQGNDMLRELKVEQLKPGKYQPRSRMDEESLKELAASIKAQGIMQPILARELVNGDYEIIAGERRWRAARSRARDAPSVVPIWILREAALQAGRATQPIIPG